MLTRYSTLPMYILIIVIHGTIPAGLWHAVKVTRYAHADR